MAFAHRGDGLADAYPPWVARLRAGAACLVGALLALAVATVLGFESVGTTATWTAAGGGAAWVVGVKLLTAADPSGLCEHRECRRRRAARWTTAGVGLGLCWATADHALTAAVSGASEVAAAAWLVLIGVSIWSVLAHVERLAIRIGSGGLVPFAGVLTWWLGRPLTIVAALLAVGGGLYRGQQALAKVFSCIACVCGLPLIVGGPALLVLLVRLLGELTVDLRAARQRWDDPPPLARADGQP